MFGINHPGATPLSVAIALKDVESARVLLEAGADPNAGGDSNPMLLLRFTQKGHVAPVARQLLSLLLQHGADCLLPIRDEHFYQSCCLCQFADTGLGPSLLAHLERQRAAGTLQLGSAATALELLHSAALGGHLPLFSHALAALQGLAAAAGGLGLQLQLTTHERDTLSATLAGAVSSTHPSVPEIVRTLLSCQLVLDLVRRHRPQCLPDLVEHALFVSRRIREAALLLLAAAGVSLRDALLRAAQGDVKPGALADLLALGRPAVDTSAAAATVDMWASYSCPIHRLLHLRNCYVPIYNGLRWVAARRWDQLRCLELLLEAGCRPTVWHNVPLPDFLPWGVGRGLGNAPLPVFDPFDFHYFDEQEVLDSSLGFIARGGTWSPATHHRWPEGFKAAARTLLLAASSAGAQPTVEGQGGGAAAKRRRRQRAAQGVRDERGSRLAALPPNALLRVLELAAMPMSAWL